MDPHGIKLFFNFFYFLLECFTTLTKYKELFVLQEKVAYWYISIDYKKLSDYVL